jgi:uncharacterized protein (TIRG00374 family)
MALLLWLADPAALLMQFRQANWYWLGLALIPLSVEVVFTSLRVQHCVNRPVRFSLAMYCNALYIAWLTLLPARLGEIAGVAVFNQKLGMTVGSATASVVVQRIYDVLILAGLLVAALSQTLYGGKTGLILACLVLLTLLIVLATLPFWLSTFARLFFTWRHVRWLKRLMYIVLQARTWYRHQSAPSAISWLAGTTLGKWSFNLVAVVLIFRAAGLELDLSVLATVAILMHFLGAIPIQSFGGFGAAEIGVAGILVSMGIPNDQAVAAGLLVRIAALFFSGLFFTVSFLTLRPKPIQKPPR